MYKTIRLLSCSLNIYLYNIDLYSLFYYYFDIIFQFGTVIYWDFGEFMFNILFFRNM